MGPRVDDDHSKRFLQAILSRSRQRRFKERDRVLPDRGIWWRALDASGYAARCRSDYCVRCGLGSGGWVRRLRAPEVRVIYRDGQPVIFGESCPSNPPPPAGYVVWKGPVPQELTQWA